MAVAPEASGTYRQLVALLEAGDAATLVGAAADYVAATPEDGRGWKLLGLASLILGQAKDAFPALEEARRHLPGDAEVLDYLGGAHFGCGAYADAEAAFVQALELAPGRVETWVNRARNLHASGALQGAEAAYREALQCAPDSRPALEGLVELLASAGRMGELAAWLPALEALAPPEPDYLTGIATLWGSASRPADAARLLRKAIELRGDDPALWIELEKVEPDIRERIACLENVRALRPAADSAASALLFLINYLPETSAAGLLARARAYGALVEAPVRPFVAWGGERRCDRPLRVGVVSGDLRAHAVVSFIEPVVAAGDPRLSWHAYSTTACPDDVTARLVPRFSGWADVRGLSPRGLAELIHANRMDVLIDLSGHTEGHALPVFAYRPAPVQVTWLGYMGTTGLSRIDYVLVDRYLLPEGSPRETSERPWRLPETFLTYLPPEAQPVAPLPIIANGYPTFGCFNNLAKVNGRVLDAWATILRRRQDARLILRDSPLGDPGIRADWSRRFAIRGVDPGRVLLAPRALTPGDRLAEHDAVDLMLDPFPYPGTTTSMEALWMGVPLLTLRGERLLSRAGVALAMAAGLPETVASSEADYVGRAVDLVGDPARLADWRSTLRARLQATALCDSRRFARQFGDALVAMWTDYLSAGASGLGGGGTR